MGSKTNIEWTHQRDAQGNVTQEGATWNPIRGCSRVSTGCERCYAESVAHRFSGPGMPYEGLTVVNQSTGEPRWNGTIKLVEEHLLDPLRWKKPRMIFVNSMSDLFHPGVPDEYIDKIFAVMALCPQHTFQILTKRPERMQEYLSKDGVQMHIAFAASAIIARDTRLDLSNAPFTVAGKLRALKPEAWPLKNVWLGVSVEDQQTADERIPILLDTPAAVRWISLEPQLGPVDLDSLSYTESDGRTRFDALSGKSKLDWVVIGGESGPKARPFNIEWARSIVKQCASAGVACFVKQLGAQPYLLNQGDYHVTGKGGDMEEWPKDLRVREYPHTATV